MISLKRINAINLMVRDLNESVSWYQRHFGFEEQYAVEGGMLIAVGGIELVLSPAFDQKLPLANPRYRAIRHSGADALRVSNAIRSDIMSTISLRIPESLHKHAKDLAKQEGVSMNQLIATALAEKMSAIETETYLEERAKRGNQKKFEKALSKISDVEPEEKDRV